MDIIRTIMQAVIYAVFNRKVHAREANRDNQIVRRQHARVAFFIVYPGNSRAQFLKRHIEVVMYIAMGVFFRPETPYHHLVEFLYLLVEIRFAHRYLRAVT